MLTNAAKYIVITRPRESGQALQTQLRKRGIPVLLYPTITIKKQTLTPTIQQHLKQLATVDWIIFTSKNGVYFFLEALRQLAIDQAILQTKSIAAVGPRTAEELINNHLPVHLIPSLFTTADLASELHHLHGKKVLLPRANIATPQLTQQLESKGAEVVNIPIYTTAFIAKPRKQFTALLEQKNIACLTFTSPSTVRGFLKSVATSQVLQAVLRLPVVSIGPVTTQAAKTSGFQTIYTASPHTTEGMLTKIRESII